MLDKGENMFVGQGVTVLVAVVVLLAGLVLVFIVMNAMNKSLQLRWHQFGNQLRQDWKNSIGVLDLRFRGLLLTFDDLMEIERQNPCSEIWIVTGSLEGDLKRSSLQIITSNIRRGITYKYILPDSPRLRERAGILSDSLRGGDHVKFQYIPPGPFLEIINIHDFIIYGPHDSRRRSFMNIPIATHKHYFFELEASHGETICSFLDPKNT